MHDQVTPHCVVSVLTGSDKSTSWHSSGIIANAAAINAFVVVSTSPLNEFVPDIFHRNQTYTFY